MTASVQLCITFPMGSLIVLAGAFTRQPTQAEIDDMTADDEDDWQPIDPDTVTVKIGLIDQATGDVDPLTVMVHDYLSSPGAGIVRDDVGEYHFDLDTTNMLPGEWFYRWESTGNGQAANEERFRVAASVFP